MHPQFLPLTTRETEVVKDPHLNHPKIIANITTQKEIAVGGTGVHSNMMNNFEEKARDAAVAEEDHRVAIRHKANEQQSAIRAKV